jgi:hypothetical protein
VGRRAARGDRAITYSFVILRANRPRARGVRGLAAADDVAVRFMLPMGDRNQQSILTDRAAMRRHHAALARDRDRAARARPRPRGPRVDGERAVLTDRLTRGVVRALPIAGE